MVKDDRSHARQLGDVSVVRMDAGGGHKKRRIELISALCHLLSSGGYLLRGHCFPGELDQFMPVPSSWWLW